MSSSVRVAIPNILESHKIPWFQTTNQVRNMTQNVPNHQSEFPISSPSLALNSAPGHRSAPAFMDATINHKGR
jgi:hypothetical protein